MRGEKGQVLIWVIALMMLAALIIPPFVASAYSGLHTSSVRQEKMQELYAADTGIEDALMWIMSDGNITKPGDPTFPPGNSSTASPATYTLSDAVNNCQVDVKVERDVSLYPDGNYTYFVYSTATNQDTGTHVKVQVHATRQPLTLPGSPITPPPVPQEPPPPSNNAFSYAIGSLGAGNQFQSAAGGEVTGDLYINGNLVTSSPGGGATYITGNLYADGNIVLDFDSRVTGNASATGYISLLNTSSIGGNAWANTYISQGSKNDIGKDAYAQTDINVTSGSIIGSAWAKGDITVSSNGLIYQSAFSNNDINVPGGTIYGWAYYLHNLNISNGGYVGNSLQLTEEKYVPQAVMPEIEVNPDPGAVYFGNATGPGSWTITGNKNISGTVHLGPTYITGDLTFNNNGILWLDGTVYVHGKITMDKNGCQILATPGTVTPAVLVADGDITIKNNNAVTPDINMPLIMSVHGNIYCNNNNNVVAALYAPNGTISLENNTNVNGAVVAQSIISKNNYSVVYNPVVANIPGLPGGDVGEQPPTPPPVQPPDEPGPDIELPTGVYVDSYIVLEE
jgi:cytoskeletal protein CcmA (bactofilin family)